MSPVVIGIIVVVVIVIIGAGYFMFKPKPEPEPVQIASPVNEPVTQSVPPTKSLNDTPEPVQSDTKLKNAGPAILVPAAPPSPPPVTFVGSFNTFMFYATSLSGPWTQFSNGSQYNAIVNLKDGTFGGLSNSGNDLNVSTPTT